jgi:hypothetical protein
MRSCGHPKRGSLYTRCFGQSGGKRHIVECYTEPPDLWSHHIGEGNMGGTYRLMGTNKITLKTLHGKPQEKITLGNVWP